MSFLFLLKMCKLSNVSCCFSEGVLEAHVELTRRFVGGRGAVRASWHGWKGRRRLLVALDLVADGVVDSGQGCRLIRFVERR